jgi:AraC-like DNA-binding protein/mannose-6-phosphate isomerase-like protein (cupin superfamily)
MDTQTGGRTAQQPLSQTRPSAHDGDRSKQHYFTDLTVRWQQTAAAVIPFVMWRDTIAGPSAEIVNVHRDFCSLYVVRRGRGFHVIDGVRYGVARGDVYAMGPGMSHYFEDCDNLTTDTFHFSPALFDDVSRGALAATPGFHALFVAEPSAEADSANERQERWLHLTPTQHAIVQSLIQELEAEWSAGAELTGVLLSRGLFFRLLVRLSRFYVENRGQGASLSPTAPMGFAGTHEATIASAVRFMEEHFSRKLRIEQIAARVFLSPDRFTNVFTAVMGRSPRDYLHHLRIEHAKMLLCTTDRPMSEISQASGFAEAAYFTRVLRAATGLSPTEYRRLRGG